MTPGLGRSHGEGIGYSLHYSWASLVAKSVKNLPAFEGPKKKKKKNLPAIQETVVRSLGWEDPLVKEMATHSSSLVWRIPRDRGGWRPEVHGVAKSRT